MRVFLLAFFLIFQFSLLWAKTDFRSGYLINNQNDTIPGLIKYKEGNFDVCIFKPTSTSEEHAYYPEDIQAFAYTNDKYFESRNIDTNGKTQRVFIEVLVRGNVSLYRYKSRVFVEKVNDKFYELEVEEKTIIVEGQNVKSKSTKHLGILRYLLSDCGQLSSKINSVKLFQKPLTKLIEEYNICVSADYISYKDQKPWSKVTFGVISGYNFSSLNFTAYNSNFPSAIFDSDLKSNSPSAGVFFDISSPRINERISFHPEIWYIAPRYYAYVVEEGSSITKRNDIYFNFSAIKLPAALRFTFPSKKVIPFFYFGLANYVIFKKESKTILEEEYITTNIITTREYPPLDIGRHQLALYGGAGMYFKIGEQKTLFIDARYESGDGIIYEKYNPNNTLSSKTTTLSVLLGLNF